MNIFGKNKEKKDWVKEQKMTIPEEEDFDTVMKELVSKKKLAEGK